MPKAYEEAGVSVEAGYEVVKRIKSHVARTNRPGVVGGIGGFGGLFAPDVSGMSEPVLVSGTDGVGTKLRLAELMGKHDTIGIDCVAMCVNDVICCGAKPLFFLDYIAIGKNVPEKVASIVSGVAEGCVQAGCALIGGETAEMPGFYPEDEYDLAGFSVGLVDESDMIDGSTLCEGDLLIGLCSAALSALVGIPLGLLAGYRRGAWEFCLMRLADVFQSFPSIVLVLCLVSLVGPSALNLVLVLGLLHPYTAQEGPEGRRRSVEQVKEFQRRFTQQFHLLNCRELLAERGLHPTPTAQAVGADDHCGTLIVSAVELLCDYLAELDGQK